MFNVSLNKECLLKMPIDTKDRWPIEIFEESYPGFQNQN